MADGLAASLGLDGNAELKSRLRKARAFVYDFDGTLVDSNEIKWSAFEACFAEFGDRLSEIMAYCRGNPHLPRGDKFRVIYKEILDLPFTEAVEKRLHDKFNELTVQSIIMAPEIRGAARFLEAAGPDRSRCVLSSVPTDIVRHIVEARGWLHYFSVIQGAPINKGEWLERFRTARGLSGEEVIYFGDARQDQEAAASAGCTFVAVANRSLKCSSRFYITDYTGVL